MNISNKKLNNIQERLYDIAIYSSYMLVLVSSLGLSQLAPQYLENLDYYLRIYICIFLMWRFNPLRKIDVFTELDRKIAFTAGFLILTTTAINKYIINFKDRIIDITKKKMDKSPGPNQDVTKLNESVPVYTD